MTLMPSDSFPPQTRKPAEAGFAVRCSLAPLIRLLLIFLLLGLRLLALLLILILTFLGIILLGLVRCHDRLLQIKRNRVISIGLPSIAACEPWHGKVTSADYAC